MTIEQLITICQPLDVYGTRPDRIGDLTQDSREVNEGSVFIAVRGTQVDGHLFIEDAVSRGARIIICEEAYYTEEEVCVFEVENTRSLIGPLAQAFHGNPARKLQVVGVTGTNGKTTVTSLVFQTLQQLGTRPALLGTTGKQILDEELESLLTTSDPVELAEDMQKMVEADCTHLVMEVSSHALDQQRVEGIEFRIGAFTNLTHDHLDYHESLDDYAAAKKRLFDDLKSDATAVVNGDDPSGELMTSDCNARIIRFAFTDGQGDGIPCRILASGPDGQKIQVGDNKLTTPLVGRFNAYNAAMAFLICQELGFEKQDIVEALGQASGAPGRLERVQLPDQTEQPLVLVDYAHTPDALENVLSSLNDLKPEGQELHLVFGCGGDRDRAKRPRMAEVAEQYADRITVTSDNPRHEDPDAIIAQILGGFTGKAEVEIDRIADRREAIATAISRSGPESMILIAGKGHETYQVIGDERHEFDDRKIALEALERLTGNPQTGGVN